MMDRGPPRGAFPGKIKPGSNMGPESAKLSAGSPVHTRFLFNSVVPFVNRGS